MISAASTPTQVGVSFCRALVLSLALGTLSGIAHADEQRAGSDFVAISAGRVTLSDGVTADQTNGGLCLDLEGFAAALDFPINVDLPSMTARGWYVREEQTVVLQLSSRRGTISGVEVIWPGESVRAVDGGVCVALETLGKWFNLRLTYLQADANVTVESLNGVLPLVARLERHARGDFVGVFDATDTLRDSSPVKASPYRLADWPALEVNATLNLSQAKSTADADPLSWRAVAAGDFLFATVEAQVDRDAAQDDPVVSRFRLSRSALDGGVLGIHTLREVAVGDVSGRSGPLVGAGGAGRGIEVSSYPLDRPDQFDRTSLEGDVPAGWDAELYRNDLLVASATDVQSGRYRFADIPIVFGDNDLEVRLYGPQGQTRTIQRRINTGSFLAPKGVLYSRLALFEPGKATFGIDQPSVNGPDKHLDAAFSYGLSERLSVGADLNLDRIDGDWKGISSASLQTSVRGSAVEMQWAQATEGGSAGLVRIQGRTPIGGASASILEVSPEFVASGVPSGLRTRVEGSLNASLVHNGARAMAVFTTAEINQYRGGESIATVRGRASFAYGATSISPFVTYQTSAHDGRQLHAGVFLGNRLRAVGIRAGIEGQVFPAARDQVATVSVDRAVRGETQEWHWTGEGRWAVDADRPRLAVSLARVFKTSALAFRMERTETGETNATMNLTFAYGRGAPSWRVTSHPLVRTGSVVARVFEDVDENGVFSRPDVPLKDVRIQAGNDDYAATTTDVGLAIVDGLDAGRVTTIVPDFSGYDHPYETRGPLRVAARPGTRVELDIPVTVAGAIDGVLLTSAGDQARARPKPATEVRLLNPAGALVARTQSAYDGFFSFEGVALGAYHVEAGHGLSRTVILTRTQPYVSDLEVEWRDALRSVYVTDRAIPRVSLQDEIGRPASRYRNQTIMEDPA